MQAGAVGYYGDTKDRLCDESSPAGSDALAGACKIWEDAFNSVEAPKTRKVLLRIGFVLGRDGGALPVLSKFTKKFLGGSVGGGKQYISWIHIADLTRMFIESIERENLSGTFNAVGLNPEMNRFFMSELRHVLHRPWTSARAEIRRAAGRAVDEKRTVAGAGQPVLRADPVFGIRL